MPRFGSTARTVASAALLAVVAAQSCAPYNFWLSYGNTPDQAVITWSTNCSADSVVQYGLSASLGALVSGNQTQYTFDGGSYVSPYLHHTTVSHLPTQTTVYYRVGGTQSGWSNVMNFTTHPGVGPTIYSRFSVIGDLGQTSNSADTLQHIMDSPNPFTSMIHVGDLSYADNYEPRWDSWQTLVSPLAQSLPWMTIVGNHEIELDINLKTFEAYNARFPMPAVYYGTPKQASQLYYGIRIGAVHYIMLSSYTDFSSTSDQYAWLVTELASIDRNLTPWVVATLHAPWYNSNQAHQGEGEAMREAMEQLLFNAGVDVVFSGHVHAYERNSRVFNNALNPAGPYYINIGDGGNREGLASNWLSPQPAWSAFRQASYGHGELEVLNSTHMHWTWHQNPDLEPVVADELWIVKGQTATYRSLTSEPVFRRKTSH